MPLVCLFHYSLNQTCGKWLCSNRQTFGIGFGGICRNLLSVNVMLATKFRHGSGFKFSQKTGGRLLVWVWISFKLSVIQALCNRWLLSPEFQQQADPPTLGLLNQTQPEPRFNNDKCPLVAEVWPSNAVVYLHNISAEDLPSWPTYWPNTLSSFM